MNERIVSLLNKLESEHSLALEEYEFLIANIDSESEKLLFEKAVEQRKKIYGNSVYIRGLIEISNICKNDCLYCGIRRSNKLCERYRLKKEDILACCNEGYSLGFRTFVMQGGEDAFFTDDCMCSIVSEIKKRYPDCAVTLSLGERSKESYRRLFDSGADRYLLRHETACQTHYSTLHPKEMTLQSRMECLQNLKEIGYQVGCGFMVGSPNQTLRNVALDLKFIEEFKPQMVGIGPFIPHKDTPFADCEAGSAGLTCRLLAIIRLMLPNVLLPATTALGSIEKGGRERGILAGANVVMPNLSPEEAKKNYMLYNNKLSSGSEAAKNLDELKKQINSIGYEIVTDRGDFRYMKSDRSHVVL